MEVGTRCESGESYGSDDGSPCSIQRVNQVSMADYLRSCPIASAARSIQDEIRMEERSVRTRKRLQLAQRHARPFQSASPSPIIPAEKVSG